MLSIRLTVFWLVSGIFAACAAAIPAGAAQGSAADAVTALHNALLNNMKHGKEYGCDGRAKHIEPVIDATFDVSAIAQSTLRTHWSEIPADQQAAFIKAFREQVIATYAAQFSSFDGDSFTTLDSQPLPNGDQLVHARFKPSSADPVAFDYVLHQKDGAWRIVNVVADGVSDLALRKTQYAKLYGDKGITGVVAGISDQTAKTRASCN